MSKSLYIIGNGFDRAHGLKTSYWDFRTYLEENHWEFLLALEKLYDFEPFDEADSYTAKNAKKLHEDRLQQELWSQLEENIGHPDIVQMENFSDCIVNDLDLESGNVGIRDTCSTKRKMLRIAGDDKPTEVVRSRLKKLNADHIRFVLGCLAENTAPVRNMKQYLLAMLYNAPTTMNLYYQNKTNHDFARGSPKAG